MALIIRLLCIIFGYAFGLINTGDLIAKRAGINLKREGSGNSGATNAYRVIGAKAGILTFVGDALKVIFPIIVVRLFVLDIYTGTVAQGLHTNVISVADTIKYNDAILLMLCSYTGFGTVLGHIFPITKDFKGGKGISSTAGLVIGTFPAMIFLPLGAFVGLVFKTGYVSLGSIIALIILMLENLIYGITKFIQTGFGYYIEVIIIFSFIAIIGIWKHRSNINRLLNGTENRFGKHGDNSQNGNKR